MLAIAVDFASTNSIEDVLTLTRTTSGTPATNIGGGISLLTENDTPANVEAASIDWRLTDITSGSETGQIIFTAPIGGSVSTRMSISTNIIITGDLRVDGGDIGISADTDLIQLANNFLTVNGRVLIDGKEDAEQLVIQGHSTQSNKVFVVEQSDGTETFNIKATGDTNLILGQSDNFVIDASTTEHSDDGPLTINITTGNQGVNAQSVNVISSGITAGSPVGGISAQIQTHADDAAGSIFLCYGGGLDDTAGGSATTIFAGPGPSTNNDWDITFGAANQDVIIKSASFGVDTGYGVEITGSTPGGNEDGKNVTIYGAAGSGSGVDGYVKIGQGAVTVAVTPDDDDMVVVDTIHCSKYCATTTGGAMIWDNFKDGATAITQITNTGTGGCDLSVDNDISSDTLNITNAASVGSLTSTGNVTIDAGSGDSPLLDLIDGDNNYFRIKKDDDGHTNLFNNEGQINVITNNDVDDYFVLQTVSNVPTIGTAGACNLKLTASSGTIDCDDDDVTTTGAVTDKTDFKVRSIGITIDGAGSAITTGIKGYIEIPYACTINQVTMLADQSGSAVVDIWKDTYANYPPTNADSITASAVPTITTATKSQDSTLTDWTTAITAGDILGFNVDSATTITRLHIILKVTTDV